MRLVHIEVEGDEGLLYISLVRGVINNVIELILVP